MSNFKLPDSKWLPIVIYGGGIILAFIVLTIRALIKHLFDV